MSGRAAPGETELFSRLPLVWLGAAFAVGIVAGAYVSAPAAVWLTSTVIAGSGALFNRTAVARFLLFAAFAAAGAFVQSAQNASVGETRIRKIYDNKRFESREPVVLIGAVSVSEPMPDGAELRIDVSTVERPGGEKLFASGTVRIYVPLANDDEHQRFDALRVGDVIRAEVALVRESQYQNPGVKSRLDALYEQEIDAIGTLRSVDQISLTGDAGAMIAPSAIFDLRHRIIDKFRVILNAETAGVLIASLLGDRYFLDRATADVFREAGTFHLLVISGLHITIIGGLVFLLLSVVTRSAAARALAACAFVWCYVVAVGGDIPVTRAAVIFSLLAVARFAGRRSNSLNALGGSAILLLAWHPDSLFTASFQLTFVSVAAIVGLALPLIERLRAIGEWMPNAAAPFPPNAPNALRRLCETIYWNESVWNAENARQIWSAALFKRPFAMPHAARGARRAIIYLFEALIVSVIVQLSLLPLSAYYFHRVSLAGIFLNLWVGIVLAAETAFGLTAVAIASISEAAAAFLSRCTELLNAALIDGSQAVVAGLGSAAAFRVPAYSGWRASVYLIYFVVPLIAAAAALRSESKKGFGHVSARLRRTAGVAAIFYLLTAAVIVFHPSSAPPADGRLTVEFLDVGQGDAIFITFPNGQTMLIDGGGQPQFQTAGNGAIERDVPRIGTAVVSEFIWHRGYANVDFLVATHGDADHQQGLEDVLKNFGVKIFFYGRGTTEEIFGELSRRGVAADALTAGDVFEIGKVKITALNPPSFSEAVSAPGNNDSVVLRMDFGERSFLLTGDVEAAAENSMLVENSGALAADVVKVPHHGSRTSSQQQFVDAAAASLAIISVGNYSRFGHPRPEVVSRWRTSGANILTTGRCGTISVSTRGADLAWRSFLPCEMMRSTLSP